VNAGYLIPDDTTLKIVSDYLSREEYSKGYILDGFPRTITQAKAFENGINFVFYLKVSDKEALWRLSGREDEREDETLKAIRKRIELFHEVTIPVIDYYKEKGVLTEINGERTIDEISQEIMSKVNA
jgi:adenylate kinase